MSLADIRLLARWRPACRRREPGLRLPHGTGEGACRYWPVSILGPSGREFPKRHTAASVMFDAGLTIFDVQRRLGHHSPVLTAEVYTHLMRERFNEGRKRLEDYIARS